MKKIFGIMIVGAIAMLAGYNVYTSQTDVVLSDLALSNLEALANDNELPEVGVTCDQNQGRCWMEWGECAIYHTPHCRFSGYQYRTCWSLCKEI